MKNTKLITSASEFFASKINEESENEVKLDVSILDKLVEIVGNEEDVEDCAKEAFEDLQKSFEKNEVDIKDGDNAEHLALASLIVKLVEKGKLGPQEADSFVEENL